MLVLKKRKKREIRKKRKIKTKKLFFKYLVNSIRKNTFLENFSTFKNPAWYDKYVKIGKYTQVLYQNVEHTHFLRKYTIFFTYI